MSRSLGIDLGDKRVGIALSDNSNIIASPLKLYSLTIIKNC